MHADAVSGVDHGRVQPTRFQAARTDLVGAAGQPRLRGMPAVGRIGGIGYVVGVAAEHRGVQTVGRVVARLERDDRQVTAERRRIDVLDDHLLGPRARERRIAVASANVETCTGLRGSLRS